MKEIQIPNLSCPFPTIPEIKQIKDIFSKVAEKERSARSKSMRDIKIIIYGNHNNENYMALHFYLCGIPCSAWGNMFGVGEVSFVENDNDSIFIEAMESELPICLRCRSRQILKDKTGLCKRCFNVEKTRRNQNENDESYVSEVAHS